MVEVVDNEEILEAIITKGQCIQLLEMDDTYFDATHNSIRVILQNLIIIVDKRLLPVLRSTSTHLHSDQPTEFCIRQSLMVIEDYVVFSSNSSVFVVCEKDGSSFKLTTDLVRLLFEIENRILVIN